MTTNKFFSTIEAEIKTLKKRYLFENVPHAIIMSDAANVAKINRREFDNLSIKDKIEFQQRLTKWLKFEMDIAGQLNVDEPFALFGIALQISRQLDAPLYINVMIAYTESFLSKGVRIIRPENRFRAIIAKNIIDNLSNIENTLDAKDTQHRDLIEWINKRKDDLLAYY